MRRHLPPAAKFRLNSRVACPLISLLFAFLFMARRVAPVGMTLARDVQLICRHIFTHAHTYTTSTYGFMCVCFYVGHMVRMCVICVTGDFIAREFFLLNILQQSQILLGLKLCKTFYTHIHVCSYVCVLGPRTLHSRAANKAPQKWQWQRRRLPSPWLWPNGGSK